MTGLRGVRVAFLSPRNSQLAELVRRRGGVPYGVPVVREACAECDQETVRSLERIRCGGYGAVVFGSAVGARALFREADRFDCLAEVVTALSRIPMVCRTPVPPAAFSDRGLESPRVPPEPCGTAGLATLLESLELASRRLAAIHTRERDWELSRELAASGYWLDELCFDDWLLPEEIRLLECLVQEVLLDRVTALVFTSPSEARCLSEVARELGARAELDAAFRKRVALVSIGAAATLALERLGWTPSVACGGIEEALEALTDLPLGGRQH